MARLIITSGGQPEQTVELGSEIVTVGRDAGNSVVLSGEGKASRKHCQIVPVPGGYEVVDLQSTNGTRMNGQAVTRLRLKPGDVIEVGLSKLRFDDPVAAAKAAEMPSVCYLEYTAGDKRGERVVLSGPRTTFGRRETNTVVLNDKMASGHHAEITKDLNGYTVRDLGSTNGTLVNGELITETLLTHGARLRVGNAKFVFKDPSMKDVEIELAGLEEDDAGWGMMAELDLAKAGGGSGSLIAALVLLVALVGAAVYLAGQQSSTASGAGETANWIQDGHFESADVLWWTVPEGSPAVAERVAQGRAGGGGSLVVRHDGRTPGIGVAQYSEDLQMTQSGTYRISANLKKDGPGRAQLAMEWIRLGNLKSGATAVTQTVALASAGSGWTPIAATVRRPAWAESGRLVVLVGPDTAAHLDDVRFEPGSASAVPSGGKLDTGSDTDAFVEAGGALDLAKGATVLALGATPWAKMGDGRVIGGPSAFEAQAPALAQGNAEISGNLVDDKGAKVPAKIRWTASPEGLVAAISVDGATSVGLSADFPLAHLSDKIEVYGSSTKTLSSQGGQTLDGARKVQLGDPQAQSEWKRPATLVALESPGSPEGMRLETLAPEDAGLARVRVWVPGASGEIRIVTAFDAERLKAQQDLSQANALLGVDAGAGILRLQQIAQEYAFQESVRKEALEKANGAAEAAASASRELADSLSKFAVYGSEESLVEAETRAAELGRRFPAASAGKGPLEQQVRNLVQEVKERRWKFDVDRAAPEIRRLSRLAGLLEQTQGFETVAATYYKEILRRFDGIAASAAADSPFAKQVQDARQRLDALDAKGFHAP